MNLKYRYTERCLALKVPTVSFYITRPHNESMISILATWRINCFAVSISKFLPGNIEINIMRLFTIMHCEPVMRYIMRNAETIARHAAAKNPLASGDVLETREPPASGPASGCNGSGGVGGAVQLHRFISFTFPGRIKPPPRPLSVMKRVGYRETEEAAWFEYISLHHSAPLRPRQFQSLAHTRRLIIASAMFSSVGRRPKRTASERGGLCAPLIISRPRDPHLCRRTRRQ